MALRFGMYILPHTLRPTSHKDHGKTTKATKTNNPNADYNPSKRNTHNSNNDGESMDE